LKEEFPDKKITIVQRGSAFLPRVRNAHKKVVAVWDELGVEWHVNEGIEKIDEMSGTYVSTSGKTFRADKVFLCSGPRANTGFLYDGQTDRRFLAAMDRQSFLRSEKTMQVVGFDSVFCGGDMVSGAAHTSFAGCQAERTAQAAMAHASVIARNIIRIAGGETDAAKLVQWDAARSQLGPMAWVSLGKSRTLMVVGRDQALGAQAKYGSFGVEFELPKDVMEDQGCGIGQYQFLKDMATGMVISGLSTDWRLPESGTGGEYSMFVGMQAYNPEFFDPQAPPAPPDPPPDPPPPEPDLPLVESPTPTPDAHRPEPEPVPEPKPEPLVRPDPPAQPQPVVPDLSDVGARTLSVPDVDDADVLAPLPVAPAPLGTPRELALAGAEVSRAKASLSAPARGG
jgi:hypothetical protein